MKTLLALTIAVLALTSSAVCGEIPFTIEKGLVIVSGKAKDGQPVQAAIYSGSIFSYYSKDLQKRFKLQVRGSYELLGGGPQENSVPFVVMPNLTFADQSPVEVKMQE